ncbi:uroporphyrinogen decarboxylase family protein [Halopenitus persicus]|uniref:uroporphyrinogen decarboxylase family protein n=1 Tax=Halopenitus persicus TaxID=1048396 RepID=UPI000BBAB71F|nr:uroporphyrinogen decarboxylase family protein [Halopenitus persicus]
MSFGSPPAVDYLDGLSTEQPFVPLVDTLAAEINQVPHEVYHRDATQSANGRQRAQRLFEHDAVATTLDRTLLCDVLDAAVEWSDEADRFVVESVSGSGELSAPTDVAAAGRVPTVLDVTERLAATLDDVAVVGGLPGPVATFNELLADARLDANPETTALIREVFGDVARAYGRAGVDAFLVTEFATGAQSPAAVVETDVGALEMLGNIAEFFGVPVAFVPEGYDVDVAAEIAERTPIDGVLLDSSDPATLADRFPDLRVGGGITPELLAESTDEIESTIEARFEAAPSAVFPASGTEILPETHPSKLKAVSRAVGATT